MGDVSVVDTGSLAEEELRQADRIARQRWMRRHRRDLALQVVLGGGLPVLLLGLWQLGADVGIIDQRFFPSPVRIVARSYDDVVNHGLLPELAHDVQITLIRLLIGFAIGGAIGILCGLAMGNVRMVRDALSPLIYATYPMPKIAILPLLLIIFGIGNVSKVAVVAVGVFFVTCLSTVTGVLYCNPIFRDVGRSFGFPVLVQYTHIVIPAALPAIMNGLKLGIGQALILVVSAEFVSANDGLGYFIWSSWQIFDISRMFLGLACLAIGGAIAVIGGDLLERWLVPWGNRQ
ncbi:MAG TPA: ABC transporter permease [Candidatus Dormibacteraeota bacterium]|nr:ABC transporter permease [Candidatus Dormibacteraeota bacterium]